MPPIVLQAAAKVIAHESEDCRHFPIGRQGVSFFLPLEFLGNNGVNFLGGGLLPSLLGEIQKDLADSYLDRRWCGGAPGLACNEDSINGNVRSFA